MNKKIRPYSLDIKKFRNFKDVSFSLGKKITVISGQNGVGKSNLLSLIASGSGLNKKSVLNNNFQPEFYDFFNIDKEEKFEEYKLYLTYVENDGTVALTKRLSFKNDTKSGRGIRIIPRTTNINGDKCTINGNKCTVKQAQIQARNNYGVSDDARVKIPTIYLSLSRLYPLGERKDAVEVTGIRKNNQIYQKKADEKYREWYNSVIPDSIKSNAILSKIKKKICSRAYVYMDINNIPTLSQSIGQDNLGNIISALIDIYMLSQENDYNGALLCIDEIDVSLHPDTQMRLLDLMEKVSNELNIQFVVSSHSLTILKEMLKKEERNNIDYKVVYLKTPLAPFVTEQKSYELLKEDMFGSVSFIRPKVKIYFEDEVGKILFSLLIGAFQKIYNKINNGNIKEPIFRNSIEMENYIEINNRIYNLKCMLDLEDKVKLISTTLGCEELFKLNAVDDYFKRVVFILDGDARYKRTEQKPKIKDFLKEKYDPKKLRYNDREHGINMCFLPDYFAPESFLYAIIYKISSSPMEHSAFWRGMDSNENTALYTPEKIMAMFSNLAEDYNNDDLKEIFTNSLESEVWRFIKMSDIITYYYSDYKTVKELLLFLEEINRIYNITLPITLSNRYS